jgi:hypothetical protein
MPEALRAENVAVRIEVEDDRSILLILDRQTDSILLPWQDAFDLADTLDLAIQDARDENDIIDAARLIREQNQIRIGVYRTGHIKRTDHVAVVFEHADRVRLSWRSASMIRDALRIKAQDVQFAAREVFFGTVGHLKGLRRILKPLY